MTSILKNNIIPGIVIVALVLLTLLAHEMGHVIAGFIVRFRFVMLIFGPLILEREGDRLRCRFNRHFYLVGAVSVPTDERNLRHRIAAVYLGGPVASFLFIFVLIGMSLLFNGQKGAGDQNLALYAAFGIGILMAALLSFLYFLLTLFPSRSPNAINDGSRVLRMIRGGPAAEREAAIFALAGLRQVGRRPREWPPEIIAAATALSDGVLFEASGQMYAYYRNLDLGDSEAAGRNLDRALALKHLYPTLFRSELLLEAAYFTANYRHAADNARNYMTEAGTGSAFIDKATRSRAEAATLLTEGRLSEATRMAEKGLTEVKPNAPHEQEWLQSIAELASGEPARPA